MFADPTKCFDECNNRECRHNNLNCNRESRFARCKMTQEAESDTSGLTDVPIHDATTLVTTGSVADGALAPLSLGIDIHDMVLSINSATNRMEAKFGFTLSMQWQDSRLATCVSRSRSRDLWLVNRLAFLPWCPPLPPLTQTSPDRYPPLIRLRRSPCALVYPDVLQLTGTSSAGQTASANALRNLFWNPDSALSILAADRKTAATVAYDVKNFSFAPNATWRAGSGPPGYETCTSCVTMVYTGTANVVQLNPEWKVRAQQPTRTRPYTWHGPISCDVVVPYCPCYPTAYHAHYASM